MKLHRTLAATALALASFTATADNVTTALDLSGGNTFFGRSNAVGLFVDTYTFTVLGSSFELNSSVISSSDLLQHLEITNVEVRNAANLVVATFAGRNSFFNADSFVLAPTVLTPGSYAIIVYGTNSPGQASYAGTVTVAVPEVSTAAMSLAGLGLFGFLAARRRARA